MAPNWMYRIAPWISLLCIGASFPVRTGMQIQDGAEDCGVSREAFIAANTDIIRTRERDGQEYLLDGFYYTCPAAVALGSSSSMGEPEVWSAARPMVPPAPTVAALRRAIESGEVVPSYNPGRNPDLIWLKSVETGIHFGYIQPDGQVVINLIGGVFARPGLWRGPRPKPVETCEC